MATIAEIRQQYPQYQDMTDQQLGDALHKKFYSDMPRAEFDQKIGLAPVTGPRITPEAWAKLPPAAQQKFTEMGYAVADGPTGKHLAWGDNPDERGSGLDAWAQGVLQGWSDEVRGAAQSMTADPRDAEMTRQYETARSRENLRKYREDHPVLSTALEIGGAMLPAVATGGASLGGQGASLGMRALTGGVSGAAQGALYGAGAADDGNRGAGALVSGAIGGGIGAAAPFVGAGLKKLFGRSATAAMPEIDDLFTAKNAAYQQVDQMGGKYTPQAYDGMLRDMIKRMHADNFMPERHGDAYQMLVQLEKMRGAKSLTELDQIRQIVYRDVIKSSDDATRHFGEIMRDSIDDFISRASPAQMAGGDPQAASQAITAARAANVTLRKAELLNDAVEAAYLRTAATGSGGNINNALRQTIKNILTNPNKVRNFTQSERDMMRKIVEGGGKVDDLLRLVGKLSPSGNGLMAALGLGATVSNPAMAAGPAIGLVAKTISDGTTRRGVDALQRAVRTGSTALGGMGAGVPVPPLPPIPAVERLMRASALPIAGPVLNRR